MVFSSAAAATAAIPHVLMIRLIIGNPICLFQDDDERLSKISIKAQQAQPTFFHSSLCLLNGRHNLLQNSMW